MHDEAISRSAAGTMLILAISTIGFWAYVAVQIVT